MNAAMALIYRGDKIIGVSRKDNPNDFGLIGGKVEEGESITDALIRETFEETGLHIYKFEKIFERYDHGHTCHTFLCEAYGEISTKESGVVKEVTWEELFKGSFGDFNLRLYNSIHGK